MMGEHTTRCGMCRSNLAIEATERKKHLCRLDSVWTFSAFGYIVYVCESKADLPTIIWESKKFAQKQNPINKYKSMIGFNAPAHTRRRCPQVLYYKNFRIEFHARNMLFAILISVSQFGVLTIGLAATQLWFCRTRTIDLTTILSVSLSLSVHNNRIHFLFFC